MPRKTGLGRGLAALIPEPTAEATRSAAAEAAAVAGPSRAVPVTEVPVESVVPNPQQPRSYFDPTALAELTESVRLHGIIQPLLVSELPGEGPGGTSLYQLIAGERRLRAAQQAGLRSVPVTVRQSTPLELLELAIIENVQRSDLNPLEEALAYQRLNDEFGLQQRVIADRVGRSRTSVANTMRLTELSEEQRASLASGEIAEGHARALLAIADADVRRRVWRRVVDEGLNVRQTERLARAAMEAPAEPVARPAKPAVDPEIEALADSIRRSLGTKVTLNRSPGGAGTLTLHFFSDEELDTILDRLVAARPLFG
jgi:ParB family transcriptional regulator, chromosome partitioning protein